MLNNLKKVVGYMDKEVLDKITEILNIDAHTIERIKVEKPICGVYFLFSNSDLVYVGKSNDIKSRVMVHREKKEFDEYSFVECESDYLDSYERILINKYKPKYNKDFLTKAFINNKTKKNTSTED